MKKKMKVITGIEELLELLVGVGQDGRAEDITLSDAEQAQYVHTIYKLSRWIARKLVDTEDQVTTLLCLGLMGMVIDAINEVCCPYHQWCKIYTYLKTSTPHEYTEETGKILHRELVEVLEEYNQGLPVPPEVKARKMEEARKAAAPNN